MKKRTRASLLSFMMVLSIVLVGFCGLGTALAADSYGWTKAADSTGIATTGAIDADVNAKKFTYREWTGDTYTDLDGGEVNAADIVNVNRIDEHTTAASAPYQDVETAIVGARDYKKEDSAYVQMLTGEGKKWNVIVFENMADARAVTEAEPNVAQADYEIKPEEVTQQYGQWSEQELPASWTYYGYDYTIYSNTQMPWQPNSNDPGVPYAPGYQDETQYNPVGFYRYTFKVDDSLLTKSEGGRVFISFQGVESAYYVYLNGYEVGYSEDSYRPAEFDITDYLNETGDNLLMVEVHKFCDGTWLEDQDMLYDGGIFRDVFLYSTNAAHIEDYKVETDLYNDYEDATLKLDVDLQNYADIDLKDMALNVSVFDKNGNNILGFGEVIDAGTLDANSVKSIAGIEIDVQDVDLWSAEHPNLYTLVLTLYNAKTKESYSIISQQLGFREIEFTSTDWDYENGVNNTETYQPVKVNGQPIYIKGVNRHDRVPTTGKYVSHKVYEADIKLMKQYNINTIRTSHYSDDEYLYYMADKYGLYIVAEANAEAHALQSSFTTVDGERVHACSVYFWKLLEDRTITNYETLKNQTSNIMWSIGNEMGYISTGNLENNIFAWMINYYKTHDKTRMVHSEGQFDALGVDLASNMYPAIERGGIAFNDYMPANAGSGKIPYFLCEYDHAMGNAVGNMWEYWEYIRSADNMLGGCIWDWVDQSMRVKLPEDAWNYYGEDYAQSLLFKDTGEMDGYYYGMGGDWGDVNNSGNFAQNGLVSPDRTPQPELNEVKYVYQSIWFTADEDQVVDGQVDVYNEYSHSNLNEFDITWELMEDGKVIDSGTLDLDLDPRERTTVTVPFTLPEEPAPAAEYYLNFSSKVKAEYATDLVPAGHEVAHNQLFVGMGSTAAPKPEYRNDVKVDDKSDEEYILVTGESFSFKLSKLTGAIKDYYCNGKLILKEGPTPNFWRGQLNNDNLFGFLYEGNRAWKQVSNTPAALDSYNITFTDEGMPRIKTVLDLPNEDGSVMEMTYTVNSNGEVTVKYLFDSTNSSIRNSTMNLGSTLTVGTEMTTAEGFEKITYYGSGYTENASLPDGYGEAKEAYRDRMQGAYKGIWNTDVNSSFYPFLNTQESGRLMDTQWFAVENDEGTGLLVAGSSFEAHALHFTADELDNAYHPYELTPHAETIIGIDCISQGNGNASCGPMTLQKYRVLNGEYTYQFTLIPYDEGTAKSSDDLMKLSKPYYSEDDVVMLYGDTVYAQSNSKVDMDMSVLGGDVTSVRLSFDESLPIESVTSDYKFEYNAEERKLVVYNPEPIEKGTTLFTLHLDYTGQYFPTDTTIPVLPTMIDATNRNADPMDVTVAGGFIAFLNPPMKGDVNKDGQVTNADLIMIARYLVDLVEFDDDQKSVADYNDDGNINNTDLVLIAREITKA